MSTFESIIRRETNEDIEDITVVLLHHLNHQEEFLFVLQQCCNISDETRWPLQSVVQSVVKLLQTGRNSLQSIYYTRLEICVEGMAD